MSKCGNNFQKFMCLGINFVSDFIEGLENNPAIKTLTDLVGTISDIGIVVIAICVICKILVWVLETAIKEFVDKLPFPLSLIGDFVLDIFTDNVIGIIDDIKKIDPWWNKGSCAKWSSGEFSTDYTLWEGEGQTNIIPGKTQKPAPFHNVGPDYKGSAVFNTNKDVDNYGGHVDKLCNDGGDCKNAPGANFGIFSGIGNGNAPRKFAQCCEMNYHFMTEGKGTRMPTWPSECADKNWVGEVGDYAGEAVCGVKKALKFWDWGKKTPACSESRVNNEYTQRAPCAYGKLKSIGCGKYFALSSPSPRFTSQYKNKYLPNLLSPAGGGGQNWQGGSDGSATEHPFPLGSGIDFYRAYNSYNKFINGSLVNIPVIDGQNKKEIICTGDKPPPECFGRFRPMTLQERATNQFNFMIDNIKNSPYFDVIFYPLIFLLIFYIIYIILVEYAKSCESMKGGKINDIFGTCTNKTDFSDVNKALDIYSGSVRKTASAASSAVSKIIPDKIKM